MSSNLPSDLICRKYREVFGASIQPLFASWQGAQTEGRTTAALGYHRAGSDPLFLEAYLDRAIEDLVSERLGRAIERSAIVEIGNFASDSALAMVELWGAAANDLGGLSEVAVATLTVPLRRMFARIGLPITVIAPALPDRLGAGSANWGSYYALDPQVCMGVIADGQRAIGAFRSRRKTSKAA